MKNVSHNKGWSLGINPAHVEPPLIPLIKETWNGKSDEDSVKLKFHRDPTSSTLDLYEFKMSLFDHGKPEDFLLSVRNFNMTLAETGTLEMDVNIHYLCTLVHGEALRQFDLLSADVKNTETLNVDYYIKGLALYFLCELALKKKSAAKWKKTRSLRVRRYAARLIDLNEYLASFPGAILADKIGVTELNEILLNSMPSSWSRQAYVQGFDCYLKMTWPLFAV